MISKTQMVEFVNHDGQLLAAQLEFPPDQKPHAYAIFAHCFTCNKNWNAARNISRTLASQGIAVLRFDFTGLGESEGEFVDSRFSTNITDIVAAASFLEENFTAPTILIGHSLGGTAALFACSSLSGIRCVVTIGSPADPAHVKKLISQSLDDIGRKGETQVRIGGRSFTIDREFVKDLLNRDVSQILRNMRKAILILHAPFDKVVSIDNARWLYEAALHPKSYISLDDADHILSKSDDSVYVGQVIAAWAVRYLQRVPVKSLESDLQVVASLHPDNLYTTLIKAGDHYLTADEPVSAGGDNFGPSPYQLLSSSLGACSAMTLRMYANRKKWDPGEIRIHLKHDKIYVDDQQESVQDSGGEGKKMDVIERVLEFSGQLTGEQRQRLLEIANRCPVHRSLEKAILINTRLKDQGSGANTNHDHPK